MSKFTFIDLFAGIGGFRRGLEANGGSCVFSSEIDKFASQAYEALYGEKPSGDITEIEAEDIPNHDVLVGGFPCQAFSVAGKRGGFEDARGTLFFEIARIAAEKQPKVLLLENVKGLVGHDKGRTLDTIVKTLNDIGYRVDFEVLNSKFFGVPQNRERIFIVAVREELVENEPWDNVKGATVVPKGKRRISGYDDVKTFNFDWPSNDEVTTRLRDILEPSVDEKYYLSEDKTEKLVAQLDQTTGESVGSSDNGNVLQRSMSGVHKKEIYGTLRAGASRTDFGVIEPQMVGHVDGIKGHDAIKRTYSTEGISPTLTTMGGGHREPKIAEQQQFSDGSGITHCLDANYVKRTALRDVGKGRRTHVIEQAEVRATALQNANMQGRRIKENDEPSFTVSATDRHGVTISEPQMLEHPEEVRPVLTPERLEKRQNGRRFKEDGEESFTLTAQDRHGIALGEKPRYRIRKLTPLECWRLQGFPDEAHNEVAEAGISDSQRYKQAGNAVTVNVVEAIAERLIPLIDA